MSLPRATHRSSTPAAEEQPDWLRELDFDRELKTAFDEILQACPNFRILILGRSGVGKSNLINAIFGAEFTTVEDGRKAGRCDIEEEFTSKQNLRLILHDSQGFSHGSGDNFNIVKEFIKKRSQCENIRDRLHAIWLCSAVPTYGGSLLEVGEEEILQMKDCSVPIVAVLTKYDVFVESFKPPDEEDFYGDIEMEIEKLEKEDELGIAGSNTGTSPSQTDPQLLSLAEEKLCEMIAPFEEKLGVPWVMASVKPEFSYTLDKLVGVTQRCINKSLEMLWASTQQKSVVPKIEASINIGKKRYWRVMSTSFKLASGGKSLENWFKVIHKDIVAIWGIYDPRMVLTSAAKVISELQEDLVFEEGGTLVQNMRVGAIPAIAGGVSTVLGVATPVAIPVAVTIVLATWVYNVVAVTPNVLRGMMGYIVDFTIVMQSLFFLIQARTDASGSRSSVDQRLFKVALEAYVQDPEHSIQKVHEEIRSFATMKRALFKSETVIKEVERLIHVHRFKPEERFVEQARADPAESAESLN